MLNNENLHRAGFGERLVSHLDPCDRRARGSLTGPGNTPKPRADRVGAWRSLVARLFWVQEAPGSSPGAPIARLKNRELGTGVLGSRQHIVSRRPLPQLLRRRFSHHFGMKTLNRRGSSG